MSGKRAKYLIDLCKQKDVQQLRNSNQNEEISDWNQKRVSSPVPDNNITPEFMAMFSDVFEESIEQEDRTTVPSPLISSPLVMKDVNLCTIAEFNTPFNSPILPVGIQKPSHMTMTPHTPERLFSTLDEETYESDYNPHTPTPATYCDFEDSSQSVDETLVPTTTLEDVDVTLTPEKNPGPKEDLTIYSNPSSILSTATYTESSETSSIISTRRSQKRSDQGRKRNRHVENWQTTKESVCVIWDKSTFLKKAQSKKQGKLKVAAVVASVVEKLLVKIFV